MKDIVIEITCDNGHRQVIQVEGFGRDYAAGLAGLLDGTSDMYRFPPDDSSVIGKCGICGAKIECQVDDGCHAPTVVSEWLTQRDRQLYALQSIRLEGRWPNAKELADLLSQAAKTGNSSLCEVAALTLRRLASGE